MPPKRRPRLPPLHSQEQLAPDLHFENGRCWLCLGSGYLAQALAAAFVNSFPGAESRDWVGEWQVFEPELAATQYQHVKLVAWWERVN